VCSTTPRLMHVYSLRLYHSESYLFEKFWLDIALVIDLLY
jgi:hypothetical protein